MENALKADGETPTESRKSRVGTRDKEFNSHIL